jgi:hypothetical protein
VSDVTDLLANPDAGGDPGSWCGTATVTNAAAGTSGDGRKLITVDWQGTSVTCGYLAAYTPAVGDHVTFLKAGASFLVLGKPATA